ncbi:hypothetical protein DYB32_007833 [Aphanomyces invadans]|uniref:3,4-dihydroxy-2-butanone-4-phosphate synthase n=1 Tax=Aphanomyces invadans TaxID=157072 RepID=A0A3R6Y455_9STRA|nr:hypothetical protein DYB32_007833 [Aphanomyces invadans]
MILSHQHLDESNLPSPTVRANRPQPPFKARPVNPPVILVEHDSVLHTSVAPGVNPSGRKSSKKRSPPSGKAAEIAVLGGGNEGSGQDDNRASSFFTWDSRRGGIDDIALQHHLDKHVNLYDEPVNDPGSFEGAAASFPLHVPSALSRVGPAPQYRTQSKRESDLSFVSEKSMSYNDHVAALNTDDDAMSNISLLSDGSIDVTTKAFPPKEHQPDPSLLSMSSSADIYTTRGPGYMLETVRQAPVFSFSGSSSNERDSYDSKVHFHHAVQAIREGKFVVVMDNEDRENEGDLITAAEKATEESLAFMIRYSSGVVCAPLTVQRINDLQLPMMVPNNTEVRKCKFTITVDLDEGNTTGISAADRARTIRALADPNVPARAFNRPASVDLARLAGCTPAAYICEINDDNGRMLRRPQLEVFAETHNLPLITISDLIRYRFSHETALVVGDVTSTGTLVHFVQGTLEGSIEAQFAHQHIVRQGKAGVLVFVPGYEGAVMLTPDAKDHAEHGARLSDINVRGESVEIGGSHSSGYKIQRDGLSKACVTKASTWVIAHSRTEDGGTPTKCHSRFDTQVEITLVVLFAMADTVTAQVPVTTTPLTVVVKMDPLPWILGTILGVLITVCIGLCYIWFRQSGKSPAQESALKTFAMFPSLSTSNNSISPAPDRPITSTWQRAIYKLRSAEMHSRESNILNTNLFHSQNLMTSRSVAIMEDKELDDHELGSTGRGLATVWKSIDPHRLPPNLTDSRRQLQNLVRQSMVSEATSTFDLSSRGCEFVDPDHRAQFLHDLVNKVSPDLG